MNKITFMVLLAVLVWPGLGSGYGQQRGPVTLYVSSQGGSLGECMQEHPCRDIFQAFQFAIAGDTILIEEGDYKGFRLENFSATEEKPLLIKGVGKVRISPNEEMRDTRDNIQISMCDWIQIENIQSFDAKRAGIRIDQSHHVTVKNSVFGNNGAWGVYSNHSNDLVLENNDCFGSKTQHGIYYANSGDRPVIRGNRSHGNFGCGIHMNGDLSSGEGRGVVGDGIISGAVVENNVVFDNGKTGAAINCDGLHDSIIRNNLLYNNHATGIALFKEDGVSGARNVKVYNNTIVVAEDGRWAVLVKNSSGPVAIMNNILINRRKGRGELLIGDGASNDLSNVQSDYNVFGGEAGVASLTDGESRISLKDWQKEQDEHSIFVDQDKLFVDPSHGDYHLLSDSPAKGLKAGAYEGQI